MDLSRYTALYLADGRECLRRAAAELLEWEREPGSLDRLPELFRAFHSLKGAAATMGYSSVVALTHSAETVLGKVRSGELRSTPQIVGMLLQVVDLLETSLEPIARGTTVPEVADLADALGRVASTAVSSVGGAHRGDPAVELALQTRGPIAPPKLRAVRVDPVRLDELLVGAGELVVARNRLMRVAAEVGDPSLRKVANEIDSLARSIHAGVLRARLAPVNELFGRFPRVVRDLAKSLSKEARVELKEDGIELDRAVLERLVDPLIHLIRNAVDHGIEPAEERVTAGKPREGRLVLSAERLRDQVSVTLKDDGAGIDRSQVVERAFAQGFLDQIPAVVTDDQLLRVLTAAGFSMARRITAVSGRGVGMDAVANDVRALGGKLTIQSMVGQGTAFTITVPVTTAMQRVLWVKAGDERYGIPFQLVREAIVDESQRRDAAPGRDRFIFRGRDLPLVDLSTAVGRESNGRQERKPVLVLEWGERDGAITVDSLLGQDDVLLERIAVPAGMPEWISGATIMADGSPAFVLDPTELF